MHLYLLGPDSGRPSLQKSVKVGLGKAIELYHVYGVCKEAELVDIWMLEGKYFSVLRDVNCLAPKSRSVVQGSGILNTSFHSVLQMLL